MLLSTSMTSCLMCKSREATNRLCGAQTAAKHGSVLSRKPTYGSASNGSQRTSFLWKWWYRMCTDATSRVYMPVDCTSRNCRMIRQECVRRVSVLERGIARVTSFVLGVPTILSSCPISVCPCSFVLVLTRWVVPVEGRKEGRTPTRDDIVCPRYRLLLSFVLTHTAACCFAVVVLVLRPLLVSPDLTSESVVACLF